MEELLIFFWEKKFKIKEQLFRVLVITRTQKICDVDERIMCKELWVFG
jgi:hypothetical protein